MPEGPELHLASLFVNRVCEGVVFTGPVTKSEVSKSPDVPFSCDEYRIKATSRGKEVMLTLTPMKSDEDKTGSSRRVKGQAGQADQPMDVVFRFGMSGFFRFTPEDELPKHAHLRFYTKEQPCRVLSFVDARRFGGWQPNGTWQPDRGPCIMFDYKSFRGNVLTNLSDRAFDRPICEVLLNQKYFNGIGNYLRAEILFRLNIPPFVQARKVLEGLGSEEVIENETAIKDELTDTKVKGQKTFDSKKNVKVEAADLLNLCHTVPLEVVNLGGKGYDPEKRDYSDFQAWLKCYYVDGMKSIRDHNGRTMWFSGDPGPMAPKDAKSPKAKKRAKKKDNDHDYESKKKVVKRLSDRTKKEKQVKQEPATKRLKKEKDLPQEPEKRKSKHKGRTVNTTGGKNSQAASRKKSSSAEASIPQRRSGRVTRQSSK